MYAGTCWLGGLGCGWRWVSGVSGGFVKGCMSVCMRFVDGYGSVWGLWVGVGSPATTCLPVHSPQLCTAPATPEYNTCPRRASTTTASPTAQPPPSANPWGIPQSPPMVPSSSNSWGLHVAA